jgi:UDP-N-acetyl-2-amino-2-deoxyglucuronate dehydrogenase
MTRFFIEGKGFIYPKHKEAIKLVGGIITDNRAEADYIVILTPNHLHYDMIKQALSEGKKVICEKPLTLTVEQCKEFIGKPVFPIMQMRYHPILNTIPIDKNDNHIYIMVEVHRDKKYFDTWKGQIDKSGGIIYNLGIHYLDLVINLFGKPIKAKHRYIDKTEHNGYFKGKKYLCEFTFSYNAPKSFQLRKFEINDVKYNLEEKENLHIKAYQDIMSGKGLTPADVLPVIKLINQLNG